MSASSHPARHQRYVAIEFSPTSGCLGSIVSVVTDFCRNVVDDPGVKFAFQLAAYELTENLVKYAVGDRTRLRIAVESTVRGPEIVLSTENESTPERLADAAARLSAAEAATDPIEHFDQLVQESLASPTESRLGLGRLRAEGELEVSHEVNDRMIRIQVRRPVQSNEEGRPQ
ncbi:MAG: hypothetical protein QM784_23620 [Polyangiaceae bacterium]